MTEPTTPTGRALLDRALGRQRLGIGLAPLVKVTAADILAIEAEAAQGAAPRAEGLAEPGLDMTPEQTIDWWEQVAYSLGARAERAEDTLRDLTQRVAEATIRFPTLTEDTLLRDSFHAASRLIEGVDR